MKITYRNIEPSELLASQRLVMRTYDHLREKSGLDPLEIRPRKVWPLAEHIHRHDPKGGFVAHSGKRLVGCASCVVRDRQWYLCFLFVDPRYQGRGIGKELLRLTLDYGKMRGANIFSLCTYAYNPVSLALYSSFGLTPQENLLEMRGDLCDSLLAGVSPSIDHREVAQSDLPSLNRMDREIRGVERELEHLFWIEDEGHTPYVILRRGKPAGYLVISKEGNIAPVLAQHRADLLPYLKLGLKISKERGNERFGLFVPGKNREIIQFLLEAGAQLRTLETLMTDRLFCDLSRYLPAHLAIF